MKIWDKICDEMCDDDEGNVNQDPNVRIAYAVKSWEKFMNFIKPTPSEESIMALQCLIQDIVKKEYPRAIVTFDRESKKVNITVKEMTEEEITRIALDKVIQIALERKNANSNTTN